MTLPELIKQMREASERATQRQWYVEGSQVRVDFDPFATDEGIADCTVEICDLPWISEELDHKMFDREHIALCNPENMKRILEALDEMREALEFLAHYNQDDASIYQMDQLDLAAGNIYMFNIARSVLEKHFGGEK